jgi:hypothetical protein
MPNQYKQARVCQCGYSTLGMNNWSQHKKRCKLVTTGDQQLISTLKEQLAAKDEHYQKELAAKDQQMREQLAAKDRQIEQLIKKPRTVNNTTNNRYIVQQNVNVFGKESTNHISQDQIRALLADPVNAVPQFIKLKHRRAPNGVNNNIRVPNQKRAIYQVVVPGEEGEKEWENKAKGEVLEQLYDDNSGQLEAEADEETTIGVNFLDHQDRVKASAADDGRLYKEQLDKIHNVVLV